MISENKNESKKHQAVDNKKNNLKDKKVSAFFGESFETQSLANINILDKLDLKAFS